MGRHGAKRLKTSNDQLSIPNNAIQQLGDLLCTGREPSTSAKKTKNKKENTSQNEAPFSKTETELLEKLLVLSLKKVDTSEETFCQFCKKKTSTKCTGCRKVYYCDRNCQKEDWKTHKDICRPFALGKSRDSQRYLIASRDISAGDAILNEQPIIMGPKQGTEPTCLTCYRRITGNYRCSTCTWPLCGPVCQTGRYHKHECKISSAAGFQLPTNIISEPGHLYDLVTPLRCISFAALDTKRWSTALEKFSPNYLILASDPQFQKMNENIVRSIQELLKAMKNIKMSYEDILQILALLQISNIPTKLAYSETQALYPMASLLKHSCVPNTKLEWNELSHTLTVKATEPIPRGAAITTTYTDILWGTRARRDHLQTRLIECVCKRCQDPTELGTYFSALMCQNCSKKTPVLPINSVNSDSPWKCSSCSYQVSSEEALQTTLTLGGVVANALNAPSTELLEEILNEWTPRVHRHHYHLHAVRHALLQLYGRSNNAKDNEAYWEEINKKEKACKDFLLVCSSLDPALAYTLSYVGLSFYEHHKTILETAKQFYAASKIDLQQFKKRILLAKALLKKAMEIFKTAEIDTPEGQLFISCEKDISIISTLMVSMKIT